MGKPLKQVKSLGRGIAILEIAAQHPDGLRLNDIAAALGVKSSSAHALTTTLLAAGYLQKMSNPTRYFLGPAVLALSGCYTHRGLLERAGEVFRNLRAAYPSATLTLSQYVAPEIVVVLRSSPERPDVIERPRERFMHPYGNAAALVFQALWDEQQRQSYRRTHPFWESGTHHWPSLEQLDAALQGVRNTGLCAPDWPARTAAPFAAGVFDAGGSLAAVLGLSLPREEPSTADRQGIGAALLAAAGALSQWSAPLPAPKAT